MYAEMVKAVKNKTGDMAPKEQPEGIALKSNNVLLYPFVGSGKV
jgi:hypothetical protein